MNINLSQGAVAIAIASISTMQFMSKAESNGPKPATFAMPFQIVDGAGQIVLKIEEANGHAVLIMGSNNQTLRIGITNSGPSLDLRTGSNVVNMYAGESGAMLQIRRGNLLTAIENTEKGVGLTVENGDKEQLHAGIKPGKNSALRIFGTNGQPSVALGATSAAAASAVYLYDGSGERVAFIESREDGGHVGIAKGNKALAELSPGKDGSAGKLGIFSTSGSQVFAAGAISGRGSACAYGDRGTQCLSP